jgi:site-specific DNA-methyltransferase (adenine-specific)
MVTLHCGDCLDILPTLPDASVDCVISDPPYPCIKRDYGMMTEDDWTQMMHEVVRQTRRILKPTGSAVFILQPNSRKVGSMRGWLFEFMAWCIREWNMVQDAWWWNYNALPVGGAITGGLMRGSIKPCVWLGVADCYRNQVAALWDESHRNAAMRAESRIKSTADNLQYRPSGAHMRDNAILGAAERRGGVTPFNVLPISNTDSQQSAGAHGHGAGTPLKLADWWTRYICPKGGTVADWFMGSGTMGLAALQNGCDFIGIEKMQKYYDIARQRIEAAQPALDMGQGL